MTERDVLRSQGISPSEDSVWFALLLELTMYLCACFQQLIGELVVFPAADLGCLELFSKCEGWKMSQFWMQTLFKGKNRGCFVEDAQKELFLVLQHEDWMLWVLQP